jgi:FkbM family methyltransferase
MIVVDLGANIGYYALMEASLVGPTGHVYAIEPDPRNVGLLRDNIALNSFQEIIDVHEVAISDSDGAVPFVLSEMTNMSHLESCGSSSPKDHSIVVRGQTLDTFLSGKRPPDFLRMDIEGGEVEVLRSVAAMADRFANGFRILLELHQHAYSHSRSLEPVLVELCQKGFTIGMVVARYDHDLGDLNLQPSSTVQGLGTVEHVYEQVPQELAIRLACDVPARARYLLIEKGVSTTRERLAPAIVDRIDSDTRRSRPLPQGRRQ